jgi:hypothetical protein
MSLLSWIDAGNQIEFRVPEAIMTIDWGHFTPGFAVGGGRLIGLAASALVLDAGRIMGAAGALGGALALGGGDSAWRLWLLARLLIASLLSFFDRRALIFVAAMAVGMVVHKIADLGGSAARPIEQGA